jgi:hypothetical protein
MVVGLQRTADICVKKISMPVEKKYPLLHKYLSFLWVNPTPSNGEL